MSRDYLTVAPEGYFRRPEELVATSASTLATHLRALDSSVLPRVDRSTATAVMLTLGISVSSTASMRTVDTAAVGADASAL